jgi:catechol 2,3-dioxygenase-like lactoylglutathione lyase family enzyme
MTLVPNTGANIKQAVPFFAVANIEESVRYYVDGLGFKMTKQFHDSGLNSCKCFYWFEMPISRASPTTRTG